MKFLLLALRWTKPPKWSAEESREDQALLAAWLERHHRARGVNLQGSYLQPSRNAATIRARW
mgnify:CR=1 FL=1